MILDAIYIFAIILSSPFLLFKICTNERYRTGLGQRFGFYLKKRNSANKCAWIHGSSVGEMLTARALVNSFENISPNTDIVISAWTNTGKSIAEEKFKGKSIFFFPVDICFIIKSFLKKIKPDFIILIELEVWPNFFILASKLNIPIILINGRISDKSVKTYNRLGFFIKGFKQSLNNQKFYCARTKADAKRFQELGILDKNISITGTMKYDNIPTQVDKTENDKLKQHFCIKEDNTTIVGGSTRDGEEEVLINVFMGLKKDFDTLRLIIVPRHIERTDSIITLAKKKGLNCVKKSDLDNKHTQLAENLTDTVIIANTIGDLFNIYALADCVFVGGSIFPFGGQNFMEPAGLAKPVVFGKYTFNFAEEANLLIENDAAKVVKDENELLYTIKFLLSNPESTKRMGKRAQKVVLENKGATDRNINILKKFLN